MDQQILLNRGLYMKTAIIAVGKEVLTGKTINTNLATISQALNQVGIDVTRSFVIDDIKEEYHRILKCIDEDILIFTGGLGPTIDDITKESVSSYFDLEMVLDEKTLNKNNEYFLRIGRVMKDTNLSQAYFPVDSFILENELGTAPGVIFETKGKIIILFPGPPHEMLNMLDLAVNYILEKLDNRVYSKGFKLTGIGESDMEVELKSFYPRFPNVSIAPYASVGEIKYVFTASKEKDVEECMLAFRSKFNDFVYGDISDSLEGVVVKLLLEQNKYISTAESCTGGMLSSKIVNISGASDVFKESFITYANSSKVDNLNVKEETLKKYGAVSEECAFEMSNNLSLKTKVDIAVSITGIAGPTGGTIEKPVGLVYFGITHLGDTKVYKKIFNGNRLMVRTRSTMYALNLVRNELMK